MELTFLISLTPLCFSSSAPCAPQDVAVNPQCTDGSMVVSWSPNLEVQYFDVLAVSNTGATHHCNSSGTTCTIANLTCGQKYSVTVLSVRDGCESNPSTVVETSSGKLSQTVTSHFFTCKLKKSLQKLYVQSFPFHPSTAPCVPMNAQGRLDCVSNSAWVMWDASEGALSYVVLAQEAGGHDSSCASSSSPCSVPDLKCGAVYTFHVTAVNKYCHSNLNASFEIETGIIIFTVSTPTLN